jgi:hypothetical protein
MREKRNWRGIVLFGVGCLTSPCCTPLIVPIVLVLLAGTPVALWISQHLGWVYGGLTIVSVISFALAIRWLGRRKSSPASHIRPSDIPIISSKKGDNAHVE